MTRAEHNDVLYRLALPGPASSRGERSWNTTPAITAAGNEQLQAQLAAGAQADLRSTGRPLPKGPGFPGGIK